MVRVVLGGGTLADLEVPEATDAYINVALPARWRAVRQGLRPERDEGAPPARSVAGTSSLHRAAWDADACELTVDFAVHGGGVAARWASGAQPGDVLVFEGPGGGYRPDPTADWHLLVGDESALPAIARSLAELPAGARALVRLVCDGPDHELPLETAADLDLLWLHRSGAEDDPWLLPAAVRTARVPDGRVHAFMHGEADEIRDIRRHLLSERGVPRQDMSCSPYWRRTMTDEAWRAVKRDYVAAMEAEVASRCPGGALTRRRGRRRPVGGGGGLVATLDGVVVDRGDLDRQGRGPLDRVDEALRAEHVVDELLAAAVDA